MKNLLFAAVAIAGLAFSSQSVHAHTTGIGYKDNGDGTVTFFQQHWHGPVSSPSGGMNILSGPAGVGNYKFTSAMPNLVSPPDMDQFVNLGSYTINSYDDWQSVTVSGLVSGTYVVNGDTSSAVSSPATSGTMTLNVSVSAVPEPASVSLFAVGALGMCSVVNRRRRKA